MVIIMKTLNNIMKILNNIMNILNNITYDYYNEINIL